MASIHLRINQLNALSEAASREIALALHPVHAELDKALGQADVKRAFSIVSPILDEVLARFARFSVFGSEETLLQALSVEIPDEFVVWISYGAWRVPQNSGSQLARQWLNSLQAKSRNHNMIRLAQGERLEAWAHLC